MDACVLYLCITKYSFVDERKITEGAVNEIFNAAGTLLSADSAGKDKEKWLGLGLGCDLGYTFVDTPLKRNGEHFSISF